MGDLICVFSCLEYQQEDGEEEAAGGDPGKKRRASVTVQLELFGAAPPKRPQPPVKMHALMYIDVLYVSARDAISAYACTCIDRRRQRSAGQRARVLSSANLCARSSNRAI